MKRLQEFFNNLNPWLLSTVSSALTIAQIILAFVLHRPGPAALEWAGWICLWISAVFGWVPIFTFHRKGGVSKGQSYVKATKLVDTGIYAIVRHPQMGVAWFLINLGLMLLTRHWSSVALGIAAMVIDYLDLIKADQRCIEKFGDTYKEYMERVPRVNFLAGIVRLVWTGR